MSDVNPNLFVVRELPEAELREEVRRVLALVHEVLPASAEVREVGSTAVPGVIGKGDIDLLARAPKEHFDALRAALDARFERNPDQLSNAQYQGYRVLSTLDVAIQATVQGGPYDDFVEFLDALSSDPSEVRAYNALKRAWNGLPMSDYRLAKSAFIRRVLERRGARS